MRIKNIIIIAHSKKIAEKLTLYKRKKRFITLDL